jgi:hypothetical protein
MLTAERVREVLEYDPNTGVFTWAVTLNNRGKKGTVAGCRTGAIRQPNRIVIGIDGRMYLAHRLAWLYIHGSWPAKQLDHVDGDEGNNRIANLREANNSENHQNLRRARRDNKSGFLGVSKRPSGKWICRIVVAGASVHIGTFPTAEAAHAAYVYAKRTHHKYGTL